MKLLLLGSYVGLGLAGNPATKHQPRLGLVFGARISQELKQFVDICMHMHSGHYAWQIIFREFEDPDLYVNCQMLLLHRFLQHISTCAAMVIAF